MTTQQHPRHATLPHEIEAAVRTAWQHDWLFDDDGYDCLIVRYPAWEWAIAALWMALDDELFAACAPELPTSLADAIDDSITAAIAVFARVQLDAGMEVQS